jgi:hypothetical protein
MEGRLPADWEEFKRMIIEFCVGKSINDIKKYADETWYEYCVRLGE